MIFSGLHDVFPLGDIGVISLPNWPRVVMTTSTPMVAILCRMALRTPLLSYSIVTLSVWAGLPRGVVTPRPIVLPFCRWGRAP